ncbi:MAG: 2-amino-4-hydroxy-6-hydroxymethyldihydropteridine diphosphokinase [Odoribacteraceae bacterium]|jgi:2-amino-4-hydroxy-6-hydroxymethyldihydropteridine diphosphokinase|nr:2-amino-4-hydroxy-6-hydroxymethyldihydropteridine diphosphokinase [Odoribacteraceae bacterium]
MQEKNRTTRNRTPDPAHVVLILGSNQGDRAGNIDRAIALLDTIGTEERRSALYESDPWGFTADTSFYNRVVIYRVTRDPLDVLRHCMEVERRLGRLRDTATRYASRPIDVDILFHGARVMNHPDLTLPHPRIPSRRFVLVPLVELIPSFIHPVLSRPLSALLEECTDAGMVRHAGK